MRKPVTDIEIVYEQIEVSPEESQQRLNDMFDVLFEETLKYLREKKKKEKEAKLIAKKDELKEQYQQT